MFKKTQQEIMKNWKGDVAKPLVSICCITYNHEEYITEAIESFLMQETDFPFEIVIGEDFSPDGTRKIIEQYAQKYSNVVKLLFREKNLGMHKNFESTVRSCKGKYIALCEGDDYWTYSKKLQMQKDFLDKNKEFVMCTHAVDIKDYTVNKLSYHPYFEINKKVNDFEDILKNHFIPTLSLFFRRDTLPEEFPELFFNVRSQDIALELIISSQGKCLYDFKKMGVYRHHDDGVTKSKLDIKQRINFDYDLYKGIDEFLGYRFHHMIKKKLSKLEYGYFREFLSNKEYKESANFLIRMLKNDPFFLFKRICVKLGIIK